MADKKLTEKAEKCNLMESFLSTTSASTRPKCFFHFDHVVLMIGHWSECDPLCKLFYPQARCYCTCWVENTTLIVSVPNLYDAQSSWFLAVETIYICAGNDAIPVVVLGKRYVSSQKNSYIVCKRRKKT